MRVYSSPNCSNCETAKSTLTSAAIKFKEINIREDNNARAKLMQDGFMSLPVFEVNGELYSDLKDAISAR